MFPGIARSGVTAPSYLWAAPAQVTALQCPTKCSAGYSPEGHSWTCLHTHTDTHRLRLTCRHRNTHRETHMHRHTHTHTRCARQATVQGVAESDMSGHTYRDTGTHRLQSVGLCTHTDTHADSHTHRHTHTECSRRFPLPGGSTLCQRSRPP